MLYSFFIILYSYNMIIIIVLFLLRFGVETHRLPDGVRTNVFFAKVPQYTIIMAWWWHNYVIIIGIYGTSIQQLVCPDPVWKPVSFLDSASKQTSAPNRNKRPRLRPRKKYEAEYVHAIVSHIMLYHVEVYRIIL